MCSSLPEKEEAMLASELWRKMVEEEHAQSDARRGAEPPPSDHWAPFAANFAADPHRSDDQLIGPLGRDLEPTDTLMDVGAGGGRHALPLALRCRSVTAVEPSPSMCAVLLQLTSAHGIKNVTIVQSKWEDADVEPADVVISTHVAYVVRDIAGFVHKMDAYMPARWCASCCTPFRPNRRASRFGRGYTARSGSLCRDCPNCWT